MCGEDARIAAKEMRIKIMGSIKEATINNEKRETPDGNEVTLSLTAENGALRRSLQGKECVLKEMSSAAGGESGAAMARHWGALGVGRASELAASKIVELSKRVRELTAELEAEKSRARRAASAVEEEGAAKKGRKKGTMRKTENSSDQQDEDSEAADQLEIKNLREKLAATTMKMSEWRNQCQVLKQELKLADKILASEVGDGTTLESMKAAMSTSSPSGGNAVPWRGRAQQVTLLKAKISELQQKLKRAGAISVTGLNSLSDLCEPDCMKRDREKRLAEVEKLEASLQEAEKQASEWKRKAEVSRARSAAKQAEMEALKSRLSTVMAKGEHDDQLILSLNECLKNKDATIKEKELELKAMTEEHRKEKENLMMQLMKEQAKVNNLEDTLEKKNMMVEKLQEALHGMNVSPGSNDNSLVIAAMRSGNSKSSEYALRAMMQAAEAEKLRLMELVAVLNKRLKEEQSQTDHALKQLKMEKKKNALMETKVAYLELENTSGRINSYRKNTSRKNSCDTNKHAIPDEVKHRLEFLEEEKVVLESRIDCLRQEKEEDLKHYSGLLQETRELFQSQMKELDCDSECNHVGDVNYR
ncbi:coiled-coil domain-containing protein 13-like isoform X2 [Ischnura elegans]|uniref:coiled-coil domain-containing protein 13-like isoform X2 n=1 Tax=Ischnura elegans TaxID=197161 RepID=UPI001ED89C8F|nr:coiled-coil domain-containing protein 13-like isoform X2 [Ischnura elegans]